MEYVDGMSLEEFLAQVEGNSLTYDEAACIADALVQALSFAHENGVLHLDIKPANVLIDRSGHVKLADFGMATLTSAAGFGGAALSFAHENGVLHLDIKPANVLIDRSGHVKLADFGMATLTSAAGFGGARGGTVGYMPPEQLNGEVVDERSDVFSLAAVLYESLCASAPFRAGAPADSLKKIAKGVLYPSDLLRALPGGHPRGLAQEDRQGGPVPQRPAARHPRIRRGRALARALPRPR